MIVETDPQTAGVSLLKASPRLRRMLLKLSKYNLDVRNVPGKQQIISDYLSRAPLSETEFIEFNKGR